MAQTWVYRPPPQLRQLPQRILPPTPETRFYLRQVAPDPVRAPSAGTHSSALPVGTLSWESTGERLLSTTAGTSEVSLTFPSLAQTAHQDAYFARFVSEDALSAQTIPAITWTLAAKVTESNANAEAFFALSLYVWRPSTGTLVGYLYDSDTALGNEWPTTAAGRVMTFAGSALAVNVGDLLVLEVWCHQVQLAATSYTLTLAYDGTVPPTEGGTSSGASYLAAAATLPLSVFTPLSAIGTRFYFRNLTPTLAPTAGEKSTFYPQGSAVAFGGSTVERVMNVSIGTAEVNTTAGSAAQTTRQDSYVRRFSSPGLLAQTIAAQNWELAFAASEANVNANVFLTMSLYVWRPTTDSLVGYLFDCAQTIGTELATSKTGRVATVAGAALAVQAGDIMVCELWLDAVQSTAFTYNRSFYFDGGTVFVNGTTSFPSGAASYVQAADQTLSFEPLTRPFSIDVISRQELPD